MEAATNSANARSTFTFSKKLLVFLTPEQDAKLERLVQERKGQNPPSQVEAAHGGNNNPNKSMILREALEIAFPDA